MSFYKRWPAPAGTDYRPGLEEFDHTVQIPGLATPGSFRASRIEGRTDFFDTKGGYYKRLERLARLAEIGAAGLLLEASGLHLTQEILESEEPQRTSIELATDALAVVRDKTRRLAEPGVVTPGPRMRVGLITDRSLFSKRTLIDGIHDRTVLVSCVPSEDPEVHHANGVLTAHDLLDHTAAALLRSDEIVALEVRETGKRLQGLGPGEDSEELRNYAGFYDDLSITEGVQALFDGDRSKYAEWQYLWGVNDTAMDGIVERWHAQLKGLVIPQRP